MRWNKLVGGGSVFGLPRHGEVIVYVSNSTKQNAYKHTFMSYFLPIFGWICRQYFRWARWNGCFKVNFLLVVSNLLISGVIYNMSLLTSWPTSFVSRFAYLMNLTFICLLLKIATESATTWDRLQVGFMRRGARGRPAKVPPTFRYETYASWGIVGGTFLRFLPGFCTLRLYS